jgi:hypothetical protein
MEKGTNSSGFWRLGLAVIVAILLVVAGYYVLKNLVAGLGAFATFTLANAQGTLVALVLIGLVTMSMIQVLRSLWPFRGWFHAAEMSRQLFGSAQMDPSLVKLLRLTTPSQATAFWNLPIEQVCGQIGAAVELAFADPSLYSPLLKTLSDDAAYGTPNSKKDRDTVAFFVQRNIDRSQIATGDRWRRMIRLFAIGLSTALAFAASLAEKKAGSSESWGALLMSSLLIGIVSGYLAMVFRDIIAIIERLRRSS